MDAPLANPHGLPSCLCDCIGGGAVFYSQLSQIPESRGVSRYSRPILGRNLYGRLVLGRNLYGRLVLGQFAGVAFFIVMCPQNPANMAGLYSLAILPVPSRFAPR